MKIHPLNTEIEKKILLALANGDTRATIADNFFVSCTTICNWIRLIHKKYGVSSDASVVAYALRNKIID